MAERMGFIILTCEKKGNNLELRRGGAGRHARSQSFVGLKKKGTKRDLATPLQNITRD